MAFVNAVKMPTLLESNDDMRRTEWKDLRRKPGTYPNSTGQDCKVTPETKAGPKRSYESPTTSAPVVGLEVTSEVLRVEKASRPIGRLHRVEIDVASATTAAARATPCTTRSAKSQWPHWLSWSPSQYWPQCEAFIEDEATGERRWLPVDVLDYDDGEYFWVSVQYDWFGESFEQDIVTPQHVRPVSIAEIVDLRMAEQCETLGDRKCGHLWKVRYTNEQPMYLGEYKSLRQEDDLQIIEEKQCMSLGSKYGLQCVAVHNREIGLMSRPGPCYCVQRGDALFLKGPAQEIHALAMKVCISQPVQTPCRYLAVSLPTHFDGRTLKDVNMRALLCGSTAVGFLDDRTGDVIEDVCADTVLLHQYRMLLLDALEDDEAQLSFADEDQFQHHVRAALLDNHRRPSLMTYANSRNGGSRDPLQPIVYEQVESDDASTVCTDDDEPFCSGLRLRR